MAQGVILAAGYASRAASNKMLFKVNNKTLIEHAVDGMKPWVSHVFVVTGHYDETIQSIFKDDPKVTCILNAEYALGMFSSIQKGVFMTHESFFILPGDCPFVSPETYRILLNCQKDICVPSHQKRRGHPIFIHRRLKNALLNEKTDTSLKVFRNRHDFETIEVSDPNILTDIDTLSDFDGIIKQGGKT